MEVHLVVVVLGVWGGQLICEGCNFVLEHLNSVHKVLLVIFELSILFFEPFESPFKLFNGFSLPFGLYTAFLFIWFFETFFIEGGFGDRFVGLLGITWGGGTEVIVLDLRGEIVLVTVINLFKCMFEGEWVVFDGWFGVLVRKGRHGSFIINF